MEIGKLSRLKVLDVCNNSLSVSFADSKYLMTSDFDLVFALYRKRTLRATSAVALRESIAGATKTAARSRASNGYKGSYLLSSASEEERER